MWTFLLWKLSFGEVKNVLQLPPLFTVLSASITCCFAPLFKKLLDLMLLIYALFLFISFCYCYHVYHLVEKVRYRNSISKNISTHWGSHNQHVSNILLWNHSDLGTWQHHKASSVWGQDFLASLWIVFLIIPDTKSNLAMWPWVQEGLPFLWIIAYIHSFSSFHPDFILTLVCLFLKSVLPICQKSEDSAAKVW